jgi:protein TonB
MAQQRYPERARRRGLEGDLVVRFVIGRDGKVTDKEIVRPSSSVLLDDEALQMIERADPFPSVPINYRVGEELAFRIAVQFTLSR